jgi:hypothetical protein
MATTRQKGAGKSPAPEANVEEVASEEPTPEENKIELTVSQLESIVGKAVDSALEKRQERAPARRTNADYVNIGQNPLLQTQEQVSIVATTAGPASHGEDFIPSVPEYVAIRDVEEHSEVIKALEGYGYVVSVRGVEFIARFEPIDEERKIIPNAKEPEEAQTLLQALGETEARHSRIYIDRWFNRQTTIGERKIDELAAADALSPAGKAVRQVESVVNAGGNLASIVDNIPKIPVTTGSALPQIESFKVGEQA